VKQCSQKGNTASQCGSNRSVNRRRTGRWKLLTENTAKLTKTAHSCDHSQLQLQFGVLLLLCIFKKKGKMV